MRLGILLPFAVSLLASCTSLPKADQAPPRLADDREVIVLTAPPAEPMISLAEARGYVLKATYSLEELDDVLLVFQIPEGQTIPGAIAEIEERSPGVTAGAHHLYTLQALGSDHADRAYANSLIGWPSAGCSVMRRIGMIDDGVPSTHTGLAAGRIIQRRFVDTDDVPATDHGSVVADLLTGPGRVAGTTLYSANVIDPVRDGGDTAGVVSILRGIDWLDSKGVDLVNFSLAGPRNKLLDRGMGAAAAKGMIIVAAAGNEGPSAPPHYPAAFPFVLAVTAVDRDRNVYDRAVRGAHIDVAAPGVDLLRLIEGRLRVLSGTSFAAPFVTAAIAADPDMQGLGVDAVRERIAARALDLGEPRKDPVFGAGLVRTPENCISP